MRMPGMQQRPPAAPLKPLPKLPAGVFARVGNQDITASDVLNFLSTLGGYPLVQQRVQVTLAEQQAKKYGVSVSAAELAKEVEQQKNQLVQNQMMQSGQPMTFNEIAARQGLTEGLLNQQTRFRLLLRKCYLKTIESTLPTLNSQIKISHLLIANRPEPGAADPSKPETPEAQAKRDADALAKIKQIQADVAAGKVTWKDAIMKNSDDPSKQMNQGDLGWQGKNSPLVPEFLDAALKIEKVGDIVGPIKTQFGYHLIRLDAKGSQATPAERDAFKKQQLDQAANPQAIQAWFMSITRDSNIVYNPNAKLTVPSAAPTPKAVSAPKASAKR